MLIFFFLFLITYIINYIYMYYNVNKYTWNTGTRKKNLQLMEGRETKPS